MMKYTYKALLLLACILFAGTVFAENMDVYGVINGDRVNVRNSPSLKGSVITRLNSGQSVRITRQSGGWLFVQTGHISGWVYGKYISKSSVTKERPQNYAPEPEPLKISINSKYEHLSRSDLDRINPLAR